MLMVFLEFLVGIVEIKCLCDFVVSVSKGGKCGKNRLLMVSVEK